MKQIVALGILAALLSFAPSGSAQTPELHEFTPGDLIRSSEVNENFATLLDLLLGKQARIEGVCDAGSAVQGIHEDGSVACVSVSGAASGIVEVAVTTLAPGSEATIALEEIPDSDGARLALGVPRGEPGPIGPQGPQGPRGESGNANVATYGFSVSAEDWNAALHYGDDNVFHSYGIPPESVGGTNLGTFFGNGGAILLYARRVGTGYDEWKPLPHVYSQSASAGGYVGIRIGHFPGRNEIVISRTTNGWDSTSLPTADLPEEVEFKIVLIGSGSSE